MRKFKMGDRVRYTSKLQPTITGKEGVIVDFIDDNNIEVRFDSDALATRFCWPTSLEPVSEPEDAITIDLTGPDWEPTEATRYFAQREGGTFDFGPTPEAALTALLKRERLSK